MPINNWLLRMLGWRQDTAEAESTPEEAILLEVELPADLEVEGGDYADLMEIGRLVEESRLTQISVDFGKHFITYPNSRILVPVKCFAKFWLNSDALEETYGQALSMCRSVQVKDLCNGLTAQYVKCTRATNDDGTLTMKLSAVNRTPFISGRANGIIDQDNPIHPDNASREGLLGVSHAFDFAIADLVSDPEKLFRVSPKDFERLLAAVYSTQGFDVSLTAGPQDHGIDIAATVHVPVALPARLAQRISVAIQAKRYQKGRRVREKDVREFLGSMNAGEFDRGILVTTSSLTAPAIELIESRRVVQDRILVIAGDHVLELLIAYCRARDEPFWTSQSDQFPEDASGMSDKSA